MLNLRQAIAEFRLTEWSIYRAVQEGRLHAVQVGGKGRIYYPEWELQRITTSYSPLAA